MCPHYKVTPISRANGGSIAERADYALCRGQHAGKAAELVASGQAGPVIDWQAIAAAEDRSTRRAEAKEGRTFVIALPNELDLPSLTKLAQEHADWLRAKHGFAVEWGIQIDPGNPTNPHLHLATSSRRVDDQGQIGKKCRELDVLKTGAAHVEAMRHQWEVQVNTAMAAAGRTERLDMRSYARQGIEAVPMRHLGPVIAHRVEKGYHSERHARNQAILHARQTRAAAERAEQEFTRLVRRGADRAIDRAPRRIRGSQLTASAATHCRVVSRPHAFAERGHGHLGASVGRQEHPADVPGARDVAEQQHHRPERRLGSDGGRHRTDGLASRGRSPGRVQEDESRLAGSLGTPAEVTGIGDDFLAELRAQAQARHERIRNPAPIDPMKDDSALLDRAKRDVDLTGFLAQHGWTTATGDGDRWRMLDGPAGQRVLIHRAKETGHWTWQTTDKTERGTIVDACQRWLGMTWGQTMSAIRKAVAAPPPALPPHHRGPRTSEKPTTATVSQVEPVQRTPIPLTEIAASFLMGLRCLDKATVAAFAHRLRADPDDGHLIAPHNEQGDGEEYIPLPNGKTRKHFTGSQDFGEGRGRSAWHAKPGGSTEPVRFIMVADSAVDALSAWQYLDPEKQPGTRIVSTAGTLGEPGKRKLRHLISQAQEENRRTPEGLREKIMLIDASDNEPAAVERGYMLESVAAGSAARYVRWAPPEEIKDWNDLAKWHRRDQEQAQETQAAAQAAEARHTYLDPDPEPQEAQDGPQIGGGGGHSR